MLGIVLAGKGVANKIFWRIEGKEEENGEIVYIVLDFGRVKQHAIDLFMFTLPHFLII